MVKEALTWQQVLEMSSGKDIILYAGPIMVLLVAIEWIWSAYRKKDIYDTKDTLAAAVIGFGNVFTSLLLKVFNFMFILFFYNMVPWSIPYTWWAFVLCFIWIDFWRYASHYIAHTNRFWWATHVTHHNSAQYNFSVSFRLGWTQYLKIIFFIPIAIVGFHPVIFFICHQVAVLYQFWIHTEYINKCPRIIEYIFVTPSHHRVHHCSNEEYLDRNFGSTFVIWDRIFGTFQAELENVEKKYGITTPVKRPYNPLYLVFHEWLDIFRDIYKADTWRERYYFTFSSPTKIAVDKHGREAAAAVVAANAVNEESKEILV